MAGVVIAYTRIAVADDFLVTKAPANSFSGLAYNWNGFYVGGHVGVAWGNSNWRTPNGPSGSTNFFQPIDTFNEGGSWFEGIQGGYNYVLPNRWLIGGEVDATFPSFQKLPTGVNPFGVSVGGTSNFTSPTLGAVSFTETVLSEGTVRARFGYAPGHWLFYATGGFAWAYDQQSLTQVATGNTETPFLWRLGWTVGGGFEVPIAPHWTARLEYLFKDYGRFTWLYSGGAQPISSDLTLNELRFGLNYQFGGDPGLGSPILAKAPTSSDPDNVNFHGQFTLVEQGYPAFRSPYQGANICPAVARAVRQRI
jgi:high affinity Mn2+ porin